MVLECPVIAKSAKLVNPLDTTFSLNVRVIWVVESTVPETSVGAVVSSVLSIMPDAVAVNASNGLLAVSSTVPVPTEYATLTSRSDGAKLLAAKVSVISVPENEPPVG